jgi:type IV pilus assembly protein PilA
MIETLKKRIAREESGFTLIELLVVIIILGILLAIAVPSYLGLKDRANKNAAQANVRAIVPDVEQYFADNNTYTGMSAAGLQASYDQALNPSAYVTLTGSGSTYTIVAQSGSWCATKSGPASSITVAAC